MISKDFHASRRALYASVLKDDSVGFVFAGREREIGRASCRERVLRLV